MKDARPWDITVTGTVNTTFANETFIENFHGNPILASNDTSSRLNRSWMSVFYSARGSACYSSFAEAWRNPGARGNGATDQSRRLVPLILDRETQVNTSWVQIVEDIEKRSSELGRVINNVTLALPHPGVLAAAKNSKLVPQPEVSIFFLQFLTELIRDRGTMGEAPTNFERPSQVRSLMFFAQE